MYSKKKVESPDSSKGDFSYCWLQAVRSRGMLQSLSWSCAAAEKGRTQGFKPKLKVWLQAGDETCETAAWSDMAFWFLLSGLFVFLIGWPFQLTCRSVLEKKWLNPSLFFRDKFYSSVLCSHGCISMQACVDKPGLKQFRENLMDKLRKNIT